MTDWLTSDGGYLFTLVVGAVLLGLIVRAGRREWEQMQAPLRRVSSVRLTRRHSVHLVQWNGRHFLVGCGSRFFQVLAEEPASRSPQVASAPMPLQPTERVSNLRPVAQPGGDARGGSTSAPGGHGAATPMAAHVREKP